MKRALLLAGVVAIASLLSACGPDSSNNSSFNNSQNNVNNNNNNGVCTDGTERCMNTIIQQCIGGAWVNHVTCGQGGELPICDFNDGNPKCVVCVAGGTTCGEDGHVHSCTNNGEVGLVERECNASNGETCVEANGFATCDSPCIRAAESKSYRGCDYWLVSMANPGLGAYSDGWGVFYDQFTFDENFGVAVDNSQNDSPATITILNGQETLINDTVPAGELRVFLLPYNLEIRQAESGQQGDHDQMKSGIYRAGQNNGAFHLTSSLPVTVYQFNPFDYELQDAGQTRNSFSNDASLILPTPVLATNYMIMARPTLVMLDSNTQSVIDQIPGVMTIVATEDNTVVNISSRAHTLAGPSVGALQPNGSMDYNLNQGDVLQVLTQAPSSSSGCSETGTDQNGYLFCSPTQDYDLTGTEITSDKPVAVWGGHVCDFIPYTSWACDHLEEMIFPLQNWGTQFYVGLTEKLVASSNETNLIKILASEANTQITFNPGTVQTPVTLQKGEYFQFLAPVDTDFEVTSTEPILIGKFTLGQDYSSPTSDKGDPAFGLVVPVAQYRSEYSFATPTSMQVNYVNVTAQIQTDSAEYITLDGNVIPWSSFAEIGDTGWGVAKMDITNSGNLGSHTISSSTDNIKFGIEVYGFAEYTSYLYPGGLDLEIINPIGK